MNATVHSVPTDDFHYLFVCDKFNELRSKYIPSRYYKHLNIPKT